MAEVTIITSNTGTTITVKDTGITVIAQDTGIDVVLKDNQESLDFQAKFVGWWIAGVDQIASNDLIDVDADTVKMPIVTDLEESCDLCALNDWFTSGTANNVTRASIAEYDGNRQYYNTSNDELIIIKEGEHLTESQEIFLVNYATATIPTAYNANTTALLAVFTNSYTDAEKSKIDNIIRLLDDNSLFDNRDILYLPAIGKNTEALLDWKLAKNLTLVNTHAGTEPYRGLFGQNGYFSTGYNPLTEGVNYTQNDASISFKLSNDQKAPNQDKIFGLQATGTNIKANFDFTATGIKLESFINSNGQNTFNSILGALNKTFVLTRTGTTVKAIKESIIYANAGGASTSAAPPTGNVFLTDRSAANGLNIIPIINYIQHYSMGAYLTDSEAALFGRIVDNYCDGQLTRASEWVQASGYRYKLNDKFILSRVGDKILWHDYTNLYYSEDDGATTLNSIAFVQTTFGWFTNCHLFDNGKIIFATSQNRWFKTTSALGSLTEIFALDADDNVYTIHTPANANFPGEYFNHINIKKKTYLADSTEIFVFSPYGNNLRGANPLGVWYSFGDTIKLGYEFGQNQYFSDDGTIDGGTGGTELGDSGNSIKSRHCHDIQQDPDNLNVFYATYGDLDRAEFFENMHMKFTYNQGLDSMVGVQINEATRTSRWKGTASQMPGDGNYYWGADQSSDVDERGIWRCPISSIADENTHTRIYEQIDADNALLHFHLNSDLFLFGAGYSHSPDSPSVGTFASVNFWWSDDLVTFHEDSLNLPGSAWGQLITEISNKKYQIDFISDWAAFKGAQSVIIEFN